MDLDRRRFITWSAGGALLLGFGDVALAAPFAHAAELSPWIRMDPDGSVVLISTVSDMGQGARTGQAQVLADELDVPWEKVRIEMAPDAEPFRLEGRMVTGGSQSIRLHWNVLRKAGATARAQLIAAGSELFGVAAHECDTELGFVCHTASGRKLAYHDLFIQAAAITPPADPPLKPADKRRYVGKSLPVVGTADRVNGRARYGIDVKLDGMLHATIRQCPTFGGTLASVDEAPAMAIPGVKKVVKLPNAVAVVADRTWTAFKASKALDPQWTLPQRRSSSIQMADQLKAAYDTGDVRSIPEDAAQKKAQLRKHFAAAARKVEATYEVPYLSHSPLEPMNATAHVTADKIELWAPTQFPTACRNAVAKALGRPVDQVDLHVTLMGGGFGRRLESDFAEFAALVAREVDAPVQVLWTREEDMTHDHYRPRAMLTYRVDLEPDGSIGGYEMIGAATDDQVLGGADPAPYRKLGVWAATQSNVAMGVPAGAWRSVDEYTTTFARESFIDECAHAAGQDPLEYRRKLLGDNARGLKVLSAAAERIGWGSPKPPGVGRGVAMLAGADWGTVVANAVEVVVVDGKIKVNRVVVAIDPGTIVNPQQVSAQVEGGVILGLSSALGEEVTVTDGKADQSNFNQYKLLRMRQAPVIEVILLETPDAPVGGVGEPPVPGNAPALVNAVFDATGKRARSLPLASAGFTI
ncbi:MAG TPA: molybdopterin cofactor-binding domain-containing protein [Caulobacteraceae bacterium]|jgi:isoquinoline 1-oxidoreductase beta subunit|nr:molybdopterin cofactor-binding domain-containing protein [Caulobacteraceae bacterium]